MAKNRQPRSHHLRHNQHRLTSHHHRLNQPSHLNTSSSHNQRPSTNHKPTHSQSRHPSPAHTKTAYFENHVAYFEGFPNGWRVPDLNKVFLLYGVHDLISIATKRNVRNLRFDFIRVHQDQSLLSVIAAINKISIGSYKLRAFVALFPSKPDYQKPTEKCQSVLVKTAALKSKFFLSNRDSRSYAIVVSTERADINCFRFPAPVQHHQWLQFACVLILKDVNFILFLKRSLIERNFSFQAVVPIGGDRVVINFYSIDALKAFLSNDRMSLDDILKDCLTFDKCPSSLELFVWLDISDLPPKFISENLIKFIGSKFRTVVCSYEDFVPKTLVARCLISTTAIALNGYFFIEFNSDRFLIK